MHSIESIQRVIQNFISRMISAKKCMKANHKWIIKKLEFFVYKVKHLLGHDDMQLFYDDFVGKLTIRDNTRPVSRLL